MRTHSRACRWSVTPGNNRRSSITAESSPCWRKASRIAVASASVTENMIGGWACVASNATRLSHRQANRHRLERRGSARPFNRTRKLDGPCRDGPAPVNGQPVRPSAIAGPEFCPPAIPAVVKLDAEVPALIVHPLPQTWWQLLVYPEPHACWVPRRRSRFHRIVGKGAPRVGGVQEGCFYRYAQAAAGKTRFLTPIGT